MLWWQLPYICHHHQSKTGWITFKVQQGAHQSLEFPGFPRTLDFPIQHEALYLGHVSIRPSFSLTNEERIIISVCLQLKMYMYVFNGHI